MDNLIDFNNENCQKILSPLIPALKNITPRLFDAENNPFDKVLRTILNKDDPFECNTNSSINNFVFNVTENDKENIGHLISPIETPVKSKKCNKVTTSPLYISLEDTSLQILSDSILNSTFNIATNLPLPSLSDENFDSSDNEANIITQNESDTLNKAFIDSLRNKLSTVSSQDSKESFNPDSFNANSLGNSDISNVLPSVSSITSRNSESDNQLNEAFINNISKRCFSARKSFNYEPLEPKAANFNNSFAGFNHKERFIKIGTDKFHNSYEGDDSVFLAPQIADTLETGLTLNNDITQCFPPWEEDEVIFVDVDNDLKSKQDIVQESAENKPEEQLENHSKPEEELNNEKGEKCIAESAEIENAKSLLYNLTAILKSDGNIVDQKKFGENLLNSLALALNVENPATRTNKLQRSKSDSRVGEKRKFSFTKQDNKLTVPKLKAQPVAPVKLDKNLKVKNEKEKVANKGPLKALIPLTNMAKLKTSVAPKLNLISTTPPKQSIHSYHNKKTSTPNEPQMKSPIAQSTPDVSKVYDQNNVTPVTKRKFGFSLSPLSRPASINDMSNTSLSPRNTSGSAPNLNKSGSKLPTIKSMVRRNSASDISTSKAKDLDRSYENNQSVCSTQLKRSSSFQNKCTTSVLRNNDKCAAPKTNNTVKKYGLPGKPKSLKLVRHKAAN